MHFGLASRRITTLIRAVFRGATLIRGRCLFEAWCFSEEIHVEFDDFFLEQKYPFWVNLIKKFKIVSLSWNLVSRLFQICKIWWWLIFCVTLFCIFCPENPFGIMSPDQYPRSLLLKETSGFSFIFFFHFANTILSIIG